MPKLLPQSFIESLEGIPGFTKDAFLDIHNAEEQVTSVRLNPIKPTPAIEELPIQNNVPWCPDGIYLSKRPSFTLDPVFHGGAYYVQEASSMFVDYIIKELYKDDVSPERVLDLCAAPGGKSTLLAAALPNSLIVSNEVIKTRVTVLSENISKWGSDNVVVTNNDPKDFKKLPGFFDLMVVDAPCSGSGLFRKDPNAIDEWSEANVEMCSLRQKRILTDVIGSLKQEGFLIYSTCSYSIEEDEDVCDWIVENFSLQPHDISIDNSWGITKTFSKQYKAPGYRFFPDKVKGEGFFIACFKQVNTVNNYYGYNTSLQPAGKQIAAIVNPFLKDAGKYVLIEHKEIVIASLKKWEEEISTMLKTLYVRRLGIAIGSVKGKDLIPHHELALSNLLPVDTPAVSLAKEDALKYLKRQDFNIDTDKKGWTICRCENINLGWVKVLSNRVNNYYPTNWRILKP